MRWTGTANKYRVLRALAVRSRGGGVYRHLTPDQILLVATPGGCDSWVNAVKAMSTQEIEQRLIRLFPGELHLVRADELHLVRVDLRRTLRELRREGLVDKDTQGKFTLTCDGRALVQGCR